MPDPASSAPADTAPATIHVATTAGVIAKADTLAARLTQRPPGVTVRRSDVYRRALDLGLEALETQLGGA